MGLDMYLQKKHYIGNKWREDDQKIRLKIPRANKDANFPLRRKDINEDKLTYVIEEVGYWRKANAIHQWCVDNVQKGVDDCGEYYVDSEKLKILKEICLEVIDSLKDENLEDAEFTNTEVAERLLPTKRGFFFGQTIYDSYYLEDLRRTVKIIDEALKTDRGEIYYQSSW
jgi:hypothetical protein